MSGTKHYDYKKVNILAKRIMSHMADGWIVHYPQKSLTPICKIKDIDGKKYIEVEMRKPYYGEQEIDCPLDK